MKKARSWLEAHEVPYTFHDYKVSGIDAARLETWTAAVGWETLLNRRGTTFRNLPDEQRQDLDEAKALRLMVDHPSLIKRPVLERGGSLLVGFSPETYASLVP